MTTTASVTPFTWDVAQSELDDLRRRLAATRWPAQLPGDLRWAKGVPVEQARAWAVDLTEFDGPGLCDELNTLPQFLADIDGATVHFVHVRAEREDATPLLLLHGWPGTVVEMIDLAGPLSAPESPDEPAYHVVIPSHPGTGLSGRTPDDGWGVDRTARAYATLMAELGYEDYIVQGGDHGIGFIPMGEVDDDTREAMSPLEQERLQSIATFMSNGNGCNVIQATRPQTIGYGLEDSPAALLTWIVEKVHAWTHDPAKLDDPHYRNRHLANVLIQWLTRTATSTANNVYAEYASLFADPSSFADSGVPTAVIAFAEDVSIRGVAEHTNTIVRWTDVDTGGHFAALEQPDQLIADLREFTRELP